MLTLTPKTADISCSLLAAIRSHALFEHLEQSLLKRCIDAMTEQVVVAGQVVIAQGDQGDHFYTVHSGIFEAFDAVKCTVLQTLGCPSSELRSAGHAEPSRCFGELALMYDAPRACSVRALTDGVLFVLERRAFRLLVMEHNSNQKHGLERHLATVPILRELQPKQLSMLAEALEVGNTFSDGEYILEVGATADALFLLLAGEVVCHREGGDKELLRLRPGAFFGESALSGVEAKRLANVVAVGEVRVAKLKTKDLQQMVGSSGVDVLLQRNFNRKVLDSVEMLALLDEGEKEYLLDALQDVSFEAGHTVIEQGMVGTDLYIIKSGSVQVLQANGVGGTCGERKLINTLSSGTYFGERALLMAEPCIASVVTAEATKLMTLNKEAFERVLGPLQELLTRRVKEREAQAKRRTCSPMEFNELHPLAVLGEGSFGRVRLVKHPSPPPTGRPFALKSMHKGLLLKLRQVEHVINEKRVLASCNHPFILRLEAVFVTPGQVHMLLEVALGGELFTLLRQNGRLDAHQALLYTAMVTSAFSYLHARQIAHRDLKPENLLFDAQGYLKLVDFGFAKVIKDRTWTLCGTPEYLAPEILSNQGHSWAVDWWTLGILLYEMLVGEPPFVADTPVETYKKIVSGKYKTPSALPHTTKDFMARLLAHSPALRLGCTRGGPKEVSTHPFFGNLSFQGLQARKIAMPFVPPLIGPLDTSNFDEYPEEDENAKVWAAYDDANFEPQWLAEFSTGTLLLTNEREAEI